MKKQIKVELVLSSVDIQMRTGIRDLLVERS
jgi:hypothetical protein